MENIKTTLNAPRPYDYQERDIQKIFEKIALEQPPFSLAYQLPTGGGKTVIFCEIARRFIEQYDRKVIVLTHRKELCTQTSNTFKKAGVKNKIIDSAVKSIPKKNSYKCFVAMVETLKNRLRDGMLSADDIGLVIIDEAHHNSFQKLLSKFKNAYIIGVTATPFSSDISFPMKKTYRELLTGEGIQSLVEKGFLAKPKMWEYDVELQTLKTGIHGDFTVSTSDMLYSSKAMLDLLLSSYKEKSFGKKTLIFNNGVATSEKVCALFNSEGIVAKHLDHKTPEKERREILQWFKKTRGAVLTSVSLLTTGFDEQTVQTVILNRATTSITLYHQMVGRGARITGSKKIFTIIDLGNNAARFGKWNDSVDWNEVFENPDAFYQQASHYSEGAVHSMPSALRSKFPNSLEIAFDITSAHNDAVAQGQKPQTVIRDSIRQHAKMCLENSESISGALALASDLEKEIAWRVKEYANCLGKTTKNYRDWLQSDYQSRLTALIQKITARQNTLLAS